MIVLNPDLTSDSAKGSAGVRRSPAGASSNSNARMPSARVLSRFLAEAQATVRLRGQVSVLLTTDAEIRRLNRRYRGMNKATDVLSFPAAELPAGAESMAGDLAISVPTARRQAAEQGHSTSIEIKILILHGLLHLAGYDHEDEADGGKMARRERLLRARLGLPQGLIERVEGQPARSPKKSRNGGRLRATRGRARADGERRA